MQRVSVYIDNSNVFKNIKKIRAVDKSWIQLYDPLELAKILAGSRQLEKIYFLRDILRVQYEKVVT